MHIINDAKLELEKKLIEIKEINNSLQDTIKFRDDTILTMRKEIESKDKKAQEFKKQAADRAFDLSQF